ncbi:MAG: patatin-like phospholipase family protein [Candidatus Omnitrophica bacterium]|nr:patatin-like phospholipase family protein [Candidatus Omnitrophota bacterium]
MENIISSIVHRYKLLKEIPLFKNVGWYPLQRIARRVQVVEFKKGEIIRREGDPPDALYCLVSGRVQSYSTAGGGRRKTDVEFYRRGMPFGIISFFTNDAHSSTYEALNDSTIVKIDKSDFEDILKFMPQLGVELSHSLSSQLRNRMLPTKRNVEHRIVSVYSPIRGTGSSTYATNLALELEKQTTRRVILVSIVTPAELSQVTPSRDGASPYWHKPPVRLKEIADDYEKLQASIVRGQLKIDLLHVLYDAEDHVLVDSISHFVTTLVSDYHFAVVDLPTEKDILVVKTLTQSDSVHLLTKDKAEDFKGVSQLITELTERMKENFNPDFLKVIVMASEKLESTSLSDISHEIDFTVYARFPHISVEELNTVLSCDVMSISLPWPNSPYALEVRRIARQISGVLVGLALGGGAALGVAHVGVIRVLEQENIPIDMVSGSSMGALVAAFWTSGKNAQGLEVIARDFEKLWDIIKLLCDPVFSPSAFIGGKKITRWLKSRGLEGKTFYDTRVPLKIISYDVLCREELVIESGSLAEAVRQSISIPGVIEPVRMKDRWIIDGGVMNPLPTDVLLKSGAKKIIAVNVLQSPEQVLKGYNEEQRKATEDAKVSFFQDPKKYMLIKLMRVVNKVFNPNVSDIIVRTLQASEYVISQHSAKSADVVIHPDLSHINWYELYKVDELIKRGEDAARAALPQIRKMLEE